jgi:CTP:molybdopterin cytidylyltransferase MocA
MSNTAATMKNNFDATLLVLGSGRGTRMGGPKALLSSPDGMPMAVAHAMAWQTQCVSVMVVVRSWVAHLIRPSMPDQVKVVASSAPGPWGPAGSIAAAIRSGGLDRSWVLITPVDFVPPRDSTMHTLLQTCSNVDSSVWAVRLRFQGRGGHPVAVRTERLVKPYLERSPLPLRDVMKGWNAEDVEVIDPSVRMNVNTPEMYRAWTGRSPSFSFIG